MSKDYGEPTRYDPDFKGPVRNRSCTDILWLIIFILYVGVWVYIGYYGFTRGNIDKLLAPIDSNGKFCGLDSGLENKKYLMFFDIKKCLDPSTPFTGCPTPQVCVKECPTKTILFNETLSEANFESNRQSMVCIDGIDVNTMTYTQARDYLNKEKCATYVLKSQAVLYRCIGDLSQSCNGNVEKNEKDICVRNQNEDRQFLANKATIFESIVGWFVASSIKYFTFVKNEKETRILSAQIVQDLVQSRFYLLGALVAVIVVCFIYILLLRWVVAPLVWCSIIGLLGLLGFSTYLCYKNYIYYSEHTVSLIQTSNVKGYLQSILSQKETWLVLLIIVAIITIILLLIVIFLRSRISIAIALIREGSKAVTSLKSTLFFPVIPWILQCCLIAYGLVALMCLMSIGNSTFKVVNLALDKDCNCNGVYTKDYESCIPENFTAICRDKTTGLLCQSANCHFTGIENTNSVLLLQLGNLLGLFWTMFFISGVSDMMLASTFSTWYWTYNKRDVPYFTLTGGIFRTLRYNLGTVAIGALIIAIVRVIRVILEYIDQKLKRFDNPFTKCVMCFCKCFCWCLENFLKFINKNAYIMCAVHGEGFCKSAREAFSLLMRNIVRVVVLDKVTDFLFFLSKLVISIGVGFGVYYLLQWNAVYDITNGQPLHYNYLPAIILSIATYLICSIFFKVYEMAVDTLFLCFLEDCERNDGSPEKPYFMSKNLMKILGKRNKKIN